MNKKPVWVLTGLAVAAVAGVAGLTRDTWMQAPPQTAVLVEPAKQPETAPATPAPVAEAETAATPAEPVVTAEAPATAPAQPVAAQTPAAAAEQPEAAAAPATTLEPPADPAQQPVVVEKPAEPEQPAVVEKPAEPDQPVVAEKPAEPDQPVVAEAVPDQPVAAPEQPQAEPEQQVVAAGQADSETVAPATPAQPAAEAQSAPTEQVPAFDTVRVEKTGEAVIAGTAEAGSEVVVKLDGQEIGTAVANDSGAFVVVPDNPLPAGSGALTIEAKGKGDLQPTVSEQVVAVIVPAQATGQDALVAVVSPGAPTRVLQSPQPEPAAQPAEQQVAAAQPEPVVSATPETPAAAEPTATKTDAPRLVSLDAVDYDETGNIVFSGRGQPGLGARIYVDNNFLGDAPVDADGRWQYAGTADISAGVHALRVDGIDAGGKVLNRIEVPFFREENRKVAAVAQPEAAAPAPEAPAAGEAAAPPKPKDGRVVIQPGNNLWRISKVLYGTGAKFTVIYEANKNQIRDPDMIYPGQVFVIPEGDSAWRPIGQ